jgi:hypothetical protein
VCDSTLNCLKCELESESPNADQTCTTALCPVQCSTCEGIRCTLCSDSNKFLYEGECLTQCPQGYLELSENSIKICKPCHETCDLTPTCASPPCSICDTITTSCTSCIEGFEKVNGECLEICQPELFRNDQN